MNARALLAGAVAVCTLLATTAGRANPVGVPLPEAPPLTCSTASFKIDAKTASGFPSPFQCAGQPCADYGYTISSSGPSIDHLVFAISASQGLFGTSPSSFVSPPGAGDIVTGFLAFAFHEYPVRFSPAGARPLEAHIFILG